MFCPNFKRDEDYECNGCEYCACEVNGGDESIYECCGCEACVHRAVYGDREECMARD